MGRIQYLLSNARDSLKNQSARLAKPFGIDLLTKGQTHAYLNDYQLAADAGNIITLPEVVNLTDRATILFNRADVVTGETRVWQYEQTVTKATLLSGGGMKIGNMVLDTDFGTNAVFKEIFKIGKRTHYTVDSLIAPWSHCWGRYYDYLFFVAAKLCRIKAVVPEEVFNESLIAYPLLHTSFERELLTLIGVSLANVVDSRTSAITFKRCIIGNNSSWFYPNPKDVLSLREQVSSKMPTQDMFGRRIYIRRSGRRRILNEDALITLLAKYNIDVIDDKPRTIAEQFAIYNSASFIIGPHGASFANLLWCKPGAHLVELFADNYVLEYFRYLAQLVGISYSAYCHGSFSQSHYSNVDADMFVSIDQIEKSLDALFEYQITV